MWLYQSFRDMRLHDRTLSCVSFHTTLDRGTLKRSQASCKGWAIYKYLKLSELWSLESLSRDLQVSCIYRIFFLFPEFLIGLETSPPPKQNQCKSWYLGKKKMKSAFRRAPFFVKLSTSTARQQCMLSLCPLYLLQDVSLHFKICSKGSTQ